MKAPQLQASPLENWLTVPVWVESAHRAQRDALIAQLQSCPGTASRPGMTAYLFLAGSGVLGSMAAFAVFLGLWR